MATQRPACSRKPSKNAAMSAPCGSTSRTLSAGVSGRTIKARHVASSASRRASSAAGSGRSTSGCTARSSSANSARGPASLALSPSISACKPASPPPGRGPLKNLHSNWRTSPNNAPRVRPRQVSGCLSTAKSGTGAKLRTHMSFTSRMNCASGVLASARPAESSTSIFQRRNSTATRRASRRSGVTSAAVFEGVSSTPRMASAMAPASARGSGASSRVIPDMSWVASGGASAFSDAHSAVKGTGLSAVKI